MALTCFKRGSATLGFYGWAVSAFAQQTPPATPPDPQTTPAPAVKAVTVTARTPSYSSTIDARSYSLGANLKTGTGTLGDVLRDVPSVQVDMGGNVSLRGDSDVTILVDGKPSGLFSGPGRAPALPVQMLDFKSTIFRRARAALALSAS